MVSRTQWLAADFLVCACSLAAVFDWQERDLELRRLRLVTGLIESRQVCAPNVADPHFAKLVTNTTQAAHLWMAVISALALAAGNQLNQELSLRPPQSICVIRC